MQVSRSLSHCANRAVRKENDKSRERLAGETPRHSHVLSDASYHWTRMFRDVYETQKSDIRKRSDPEQLSMGHTNIFSMWESNPWHSKAVGRTTTPHQNQSSDDKTKNETDFIMPDKKHIIFMNISMINRFNTGSDHRLVRCTRNINFKLERRRRLMSVLRPTVPQAGHNAFQ